MAANPTTLRRVAIGLTCSCLALLSASTVRAQHFPDDARLLEIITTRVDEGLSTGIVLGVLEADGRRRVVAYGDPGPEAEPLGPRSVFEIGSITKVFTGILLAEMAARGEVGLDAPLRDFVHEGVAVPSRDGRDITLLDIATHRSSLPRLPNNCSPLISRIRMPTTRMRRSMSSSRASS